MERENKDTITLTWIKKKLFDRITKTNRYTTTTKSFWR
jgi:hypothetical protein